MDPASEGEICLIDDAALSHICFMTCSDNDMFLRSVFPVKADPSQKATEEAESAAGLGPDLTASVETTYSEQSSSSAGSASSSDQPIYFRYVFLVFILFIYFKASKNYVL